MEISAIITGIGVLAMIVINTVVIVRARHQANEKMAEIRGATSSQLKQLQNDIPHLQDGLDRISEQIGELQVSQASAFSTLTEQVRGHEVRITRLEEK